MGDRVKEFERKIIYVCINLQNCVDNGSYVCQVFAWKDCITKIVKRAVSNKMEKRVRSPPHCKHPELWSMCWHTLSTLSSLFFCSLLRTRKMHVFTHVHACVCVSVCVHSLIAAVHASQTHGCTRDGLSNCLFYGCARYDFARLCTVYIIHSSDLKCHQTNRQLSTDLQSVCCKI